MCFFVVEVGIWTEVFDDNASLSAEIDSRSHIVYGGEKGEGFREGRGVDERRQNKGKIFLMNYLWINLGE